MCERGERGDIIIIHSCRDMEPSFSVQLRRTVELSPAWVCPGSVVGLLVRLVRHTRSGRPFRASCVGYSSNRRFLLFRTCGYTIQMIWFRCSSRWLPLESMSYSLADFRTSTTSSNVTLV